MGLYDSVRVDCPHCGSSVEMQCKGSEEMMHYTVETAPVFVLHQVMNGNPSHCINCDRWLLLTDPRSPLQEPERPPTVVLKVRYPENPREHPQGMKWWPLGRPVGLDDIEE